MRRGPSLLTLLRFSSETLSGAGRRPRSATSGDETLKSRRRDADRETDSFQRPGLTASFPAAGKGYETAAGMTRRFSFLRRW